jgi:hypothetical protein
MKAVIYILQKFYKSVLRVSGHIFDYVLTIDTPSNYTYSARTREVLHAEETHHNR